MNLLITAALLGTVLLPAPPPALALPRVDRVLHATGPAAAGGAPDQPVPRTPGAVWPLGPDGGGSGGPPQVVAPFVAPAERWSAGHRGADLLGTAGAAVRAPVAGTVRFVGRVAGQDVLVLEHGGFRTTYQPVRSALHVGDRVGAGAEVGVLEAAPSHCVPRACLHWGLVRVVGHGSTRHEEYADPLGLLGRGPVRLLPVTSGGERSPG